MTQEPNDEFFTLVDEDEIYEEPVDSRSRWLTVGIVVLSLAATIFLGITGLRLLNAASDDAAYADKTWVMSGTYVDLTPDLKTKSNVAKYSGALPADKALNGMTLKSEITDPKVINAGETVEFRGSQVGSVKSDFPETVDALLAQTSDKQVEVIRTGEKGSLSEITSGSVRGEKLGGWASLIGAVLVFVAGVGGAIWLNRRGRYSYYDEEEDYVEEA